MFNKKTLFLYQQYHISEPKKIRFVEVVISFCKGAGVKEVGSNQIKHTLLRSRITIETDEDTMATTRSEDTWFILQVNKTAFDQNQKKPFSLTLALKRNVHMNRRK